MIHGFETFHLKTTALVEWDVTWFGTWLTKIRNIRYQKTIVFIFTTLIIYSDFKRYICE